MSKEQGVNSLPEYCLYGDYGITVWQCFLLCRVWRLFIYNYDIVCQVYTSF